jgi:hypothetical protein
MYDRAISTGNIHNLVYIPSTFCVGALRANALQPITTYLRQLGRWADVGRRRGVQLGLRWQPLIRL